MFAVDNITGYSTLTVDVMYGWKKNPGHSGKMASSYSTHLEEHTALALQLFALVLEASHKYFQEE